MAADSSHSFRYEPELCTLAEGQTLSDWRQARKDDRPARRRGLALRRGSRTRGTAVAHTVPASSR